MKTDRPKFNLKKSGISGGGRSNKGNKNILISNYMDENLGKDNENDSISEKLDESSGSFQSSSEIEEQGKYFVGGVANKEEENKTLISKSKCDTQD